MPGGLVRSNTLCGRDVLRDRPGRANRRAIPVCEPDHYLPRGPKRPTKPKVEDQTLRRLGFRICKHNVNGEVVTPTPRNQIQRVAGYVSRHRDTAARKATCARDRVAAKTDDRVLQQRCRPIDPICFCASDTIVRYESTGGLKHGLAIRWTRSHSSLSRVLSLPISI